MASTTGGLTRRRGGAAGTSTEDGTDRNASPAPRAGPAESSYTGGENGHKIAFDPRDLSESVERSKQPKLTLMEEVLLMGLKDKQVCKAADFIWFSLDSNCFTKIADFAVTIGVSFFLERQHFIRTPWLHCHRACIQRPHQYAERFRKAALPPLRSNN